jgi:hypothetical protein
MLMQAKPSRTPETVCCNVLGITERASTHPPAPAAHIVDLCFVNVSVLDVDGQVVPRAKMRIDFAVTVNVIPPVQSMP